MNVQAAPTVRLNVETTTRCAKLEGLGDHCFAAKFPFKTLPERLMKRSLATGFVFGIGRAIRPPMKNLHSDLHHEREVPGDAIMGAAERPKKIRIVFEDDLNVGGAEVLIKHSNASAKRFVPEFRNHNQLDWFSIVRAAS
jgi:hypothetical protein